jgi:tetratricopeptide (TPR) repeat protein
MRFLPVALLFLSCSAVAQKPATADSVFVGAVVKLRGGNFVDAESGFRRTAEMEPDRIRGHLGVAQVFMAQKNVAGAMGYLKAEAEKNPQRLDLPVALGDTAVRAALYDLAITRFQSVLAHLDDATAKTLEVPRGASAATLNHDPAADPLAESLQVLTVRDLTPKGAAGVHLRLAEVLRFKGDHAEALNEWQKTSELLPNTGWVLANLGLEQEVTGRKADAMKTYRECLTVAPDNPLVLNNLAFLLSESGGDLYESLRYARRAALLAPGNPEIMDTQGWIAMKQGHLDDAIGTFLKNLLREPGKPEFRKHLAMALTQRGVHSPEIDELVKALNAPVVAGDDARILQLLDKTEKK